MEIKYIWLTALIIVACALLIIYVLRRRKSSKKRSILIANTSVLTKLPGYAKKYRRYTVSVIVATALLGVMLLTLSASAGRLVKATTVTPEQYNRDIMLCLDVSSSMFPFDEAITDTYLELIDGFKGERVSMVVWNSTAYQEFPFTDDYAFLSERLLDMKQAFAEADKDPDKAILRFFGSVNSAVSSSSLVGDGLAACALKFDKQDSDETRHRSIVLSTDNAVLGSETITLPEAVDMLEKRDIALYTIDPYGDTGSSFSVMLKDETERIGGNYFKLGNGQVSKEIVEKVNETQIESFKGEKRKVIFDEPNTLLAILAIAFPTYLFFIIRGRL